MDHSIHALSFDDAPWCLELYWVEFYQDHVALFRVRGKMLAVSKLFYLLGCLVEVGVRSVQLFLPSLCNMEVTQALSFKSSW